MVGLRDSLVRLGWVWRLTPHDVDVFMEVYECTNAMGRVMNDWDDESYERLIDAGWIRIVNEIVTDEGGVTKVVKSNTLDSVVKGFCYEMGVFLDIMGEHLQCVVEMVDNEDNCGVFGKNDVYKWIKKSKQVVGVTDELVLGKYIP